MILPASFRRLLALLSLALALLLPTLGRGQAYDDFLFPDHSGSGFAGNWSPATTVEDNLVYAGLHSGGHAAGGPVGGSGVSGQSFRNLNQVYDSGIVYISAAVLGGGGYSNLTLYRNTTEQLSLGIVFDTATNRASTKFAAFEQRTGNYTASEVAVDAATHLIIARIDFSTNQADIFIDPDLSQPLGTPTIAFVNANGKPYDFDRLRIEITGVAKLDEVRVVTDYAALSARTTSPAVSEASASPVTDDGATLRGNVSQDGGLTISERGFVYAPTGMNSDPVLGGGGVVQVTAAGTVGRMAAPVSGLGFGTSYTFKAYATNSIGTTYSRQATFVPGVIPPTVENPGVPSRTLTSATLSATVSASGSAAVTERGFVYALTATDSDPNPGDFGVTKITAGSGTGSFTAAVTDLQTGASYTFKGYASNSSGTSFTDAVNFVPGAIPPTLGSPSSTNITATSADLSAEIVSANGGTITAKGFVFAPTAIDSDPQPGDAGTTQISATGTDLAATLHRLAPQTTYSFRAFATTDNGTGLSAVATFTTAAGFGIAYDDFNLPANSGTGWANAWSPATTAAPNLTYPGLHSGGSAVGPTGQTFRTLSTAQTTGLVYVSALLNGASGGYANFTLFQGLAERISFGVVFDPSANSSSARFGLYAKPASETLFSTVEVDAATHLVVARVDLDANQVDLFIDPDLLHPFGTPALTYTASSGRDFDFNRIRLEVTQGAMVSGSTRLDEIRVVDGDPALLAARTTTPALDPATASAVSFTTATVASSVTQDGGDEITERGFVLAPTATDSDPRLGDASVTKVAATGTTGAFSADLTGLDDDVTYSFRAFATNSLGTTYTPTLTFTTLKSGPDFLGADDAVVATTGTTRLYPLANDLSPNGLPLTLVSVSNPAIQIDGRSLVIPAGFSGTFTYTFTDGTLTGQATITVGTAAPVTRPSGWAGLLYDTAGELSGRVFVTRTRQRTYFVINVGTRRTTLYTPSPEVMVRSTPLGSFSSTVTANGRLSFVLQGGEGELSGQLRPALRASSAAQYNIALSGADTALAPGGGYLRVRRSTLGYIRFTGKLPDGRTVSGGNLLLDNQSFVTWTVLPLAVPGVFGGEAILADLAASDLTGEYLWQLPAQPQGLHAGGLETTLRLNGSLHSAQDQLPTGPVTLELSGGDLAPAVTFQTNAHAGRLDLTADIRAWSLTRSAGLFTTRLRLPDGRTVDGSGVFLPKTGTAWGFFPGTSEGGALELRRVR